MNWRPRLVALDIDGTLTPVGSNDISPAVKAAVTRVAEHGAHVVLCTGRSLVGWSVLTCRQRVPICATAILRRSGAIGHSGLGPTLQCLSSPRRRTAAG